MTKILSDLHATVWGIPTLVLILGLGLYLSIRTGFCQLRFLGAAFRQVFSRKAVSEDGTVSPFRALCTALAATVGTGNLAGVAGAIALGGPGAVFWIWISGLLGMVTKFAEATLAIRYRSRTDHGEYVGGPMYMIRQGMGKRLQFLAPVYCFFGIVAAFGVGNATQINALLDSIKGAAAWLGVSMDRKACLWLSLAIALLLGMLLLGGGKRVGAAAEKLVPFASGGYVLMCIGVLSVCRESVPGAFAAIFQGAFAPKAVTGGMIGAWSTTLRIGISRGVFTNEAGMGTAAIAHGSAQVEHPVQQGMMGILEVFLDTIVICTLTALVILSSGIAIPYGVDEGVALTGRAFSSVCGGWALVVIALFLALFALATVLGWGLYGARCAEFLFGSKVLRSFVVLQMATVVLSAALNTGIIWLLADIVNGLMSIPNLITLAVLSGELIRLTRSYPGSSTAAGGNTYENLYQRQSLRAFSHEKVPSLCRGGRAPGEENLPSEHRPA